jgi:hypothetical protein
VLLLVLVLLPVNLLVTCLSPARHLLVTCSSPACHLLVTRVAAAYDPALRRRRGQAADSLTPVLAPPKPFTDPLLPACHPPPTNHTPKLFACAQVGCKAVAATSWL